MAMKVTVNVLLIGGGGREHAIAWKLSQDSTRHIFVAPGNAGTSTNKNISNCDLNINDHSAIVTFCQKNQISLVVVGPEAPLADGLSDHLTSKGIKCFGPCQKAAQIETSKAFAKEFMDRYKVPTARWKSFTNASDAKNYILNAPYNALVVKASGLAAGKGVIVGKDKQDAIAAVDILKEDKALSSASSTIVIEELLTGEEVSVLCFSDGNTISVMPPAQDHKRLSENDEGPMTGGVGAYCRCPLVSPKDLKYVQEEVLQKTINGMKKDGTPFIGVLYAGLMLTKDGPKVLEFNCRFGDPETQVILPLLQNDLYNIMMACVDGKLGSLNIEWALDKSAVGVVLISSGYPGSYPKGKVITGLEQLCAPDYQVFHAGTAKKSNDIVTSGGRVLVVVALANSLEKAVSKAMDGSSKVHFDGAFYRKDIAHKALKRSANDGLTYKSSGVDIESADNLVQKIKSLTKQTVRPEVCGGIGGFGGIFELSSFTDPLLVSKIGSLGEKLKVFQDCRKFEAAGFELVANSVNELLCGGAEPLFFLDTFTCGKLDVDVAAQVIMGIAKACKEANCTLIGGETAEMPGMYSTGDFDLTAFARGAVDRFSLLPQKSKIHEGDTVIGFLTNSVNSSSFTLIKNLINKLGLEYSSKFDGNSTIGEMLLATNDVLVKTVLPLIRRGYIKSAKFIDVGGLDAIKNVLPDGYFLDLDESSWKIPEVYKWIENNANLSKDQMHKMFNLGIGLVLVVEKNIGGEVLKCSKNDGANAVVIGHIKKADSDFKTSTLSDLEIQISSLIKSTVRPGFGEHSEAHSNFFDLNASGYVSPYLVSGTDGVGTKLKIAQVCNKHDTIGIDLVAMCANDILTHGAEPLFFLACLDCDSLESEQTLSIISGIAEGCKQANCALADVEINELPDIYSSESQTCQDHKNYDVVGYSEGALHKTDLLPQLSQINQNDIVIGIQSSGAHSNGYSLIRKLVEVKNFRYQDPFPLDESMTLGEALLTPTKIYVRSLLPLMRKRLIKAAAHITGGGLTENIPRVLPEKFGIELDGNGWVVPKILQWVAEEAKLPGDEMLKTFNCGLGMVLIVDGKHKKEVLDGLKEAGETAAKVGHVTTHKAGTSKVEVKNFKLGSKSISKKKKKVGVLISGSGTNLQALIDYTQNPCNLSSAEIVLVLSNVPGVEGLKRAERASIPTKVLSHKGFKSRVEFDMAVNAILQESGVEIVCLAGFMRILSKEFVHVWQGKLLNIHPALLPSFKGANAHQQALALGVKITGCTAHFVEAEVDAGAIIEQAAVRVEATDTEKSLQEKVKVLEHQIFPKALELLASGKIYRGPEGKLCYN